MGFFKRKKEAEPTPASSAESTGAELPASDSGPPTTQFLTGDEGTDRSTVQVLLEAIRGVSESRDLEALLIDIVDRSVEITGAERGLLLLRGDGGELDVRVKRNRGAKEIDGDLRFSTTVAKRVLDEVQPVRATVQSESEALELGRSVYDLKLRAVMCVPLAPEAEAGREKERPSGVLYVDSRAASRQFSQRDLSLFAALAQHISIALQNARLHLDSLEKVRLEQSLELAGAIQRDLMPQVPDDVPGYDVHGWYRPAEVAAGDFYDFIRCKDGGVGVVVGDVTGHGIGPALITASAQATLRSFMRFVADPGQVVTLLNEDLSQRMEDGRFVTLYLATLAEDGTVATVNGGHALPFVWRKATGEIERIEGGGPALGMIPDETYEHAALALESGDVLVIYTDGLTESRDPIDRERMFGEDGVKRVLAEAAAAGADAKTITLLLAEAALELAGGEREDDITVVVARRK